MSEIILIDGVKTTLEKPDLDGDGVKGGIETLQQQKSVTHIMQDGENAQLLDKLNKDIVDSKSRLSSVDFISRLSNFQLPYVSAYDSLLGIGFIPTDMGIVTRVVKRNVVSVEGEGRKEMISMIGAKNDKEIEMASGGAWSKIKSSFLGMGNKE